MKGRFYRRASAKAGKFEIANNGTMFLDEIGGYDAIHPDKDTPCNSGGEFEEG